MAHSRVSQELRLRSLACLAAGLAAFWLRGEGTPAADAPMVFVDVAIPSGIDFVETIGDDEMTNIVESTGVGCAFVDYDGDGWLDIYLVNGCWLQGVSATGLDPARREALAHASDRLYRNQRDGTFKDVTRAAGILPGGYGMGVVAADYDNDGDMDLYVTNDGPNHLYRNNGDGTFMEVAEAAGVADPQFSVGAVFLDYDRDGRLDLYVGNYITYDPSVTPEHARHIVRSPLVYQGQQDRLYRGNRDGSFTDVTRAAGLEKQPPGRAMGVGAFDYDGDRFLDVLVANDGMENYLWRNRGDGTFENQALMAGVAFNEAGAGTASMAVEFGDYDSDGALDVLVPDMGGGCLYHNLGGGLFEDVSARSGLFSVLSRHHSWGGVLADFDLDGHLDIYVANGDATRLEPQQSRLFHGTGRASFLDVTSTGGPGLSQKFVSRGVAQGDFDNDGDVDLLVNNLNSRPMLLRNDTRRGDHHWLTVEILDRPGRCDALGATVKIPLGDRVLTRARLSGGSYISQHDHRLHFGLGLREKVERLQVIWPDGKIEELRDVAADRRIKIERSDATSSR